MSEHCDGFRDKIPNGVCMGDKHECCSRCLNSKTPEEQEKMMRPTSLDSSVQLEMI